VVSDPEDDESWPTVTVNPDYAYVAEPSAYSTAGPGRRVRNR
jgi:hypothetical protein